MSHRTLRIRLTSRTIYVNRTPDRGDCLGVPGVVTTTLAHGTDTVRPNCNFLTRGTHFTRVYTSRRVIFIKPSPRTVHGVNSGSATGRAVRQINIPAIPNDSNLLVSRARTCQVTTRVNCPIVVGTATNNNKQKVHLIRARTSVDGTFVTTRNRTRTTFNGPNMCLRGFIRQPHRVRFRVLTSDCNGIIRLNRQSYSVRQQRRGLLRRTPDPVLATRRQRGVNSTTILTTGTVGCINTNAIRFLMSNRNGFCFVRVGAHVRMRRPIARVVAKVSLVTTRLQITRKSGLPFARRRVRFQNRTVRYHVGTRSPSRGFHPGPNHVGNCLTPNNVKIEVSSRICASCRVPPCCSSLVNGLVI